MARVETVTAARYAVSTRHGASWLCYLRALKLGDASCVVPIDKLSVVLVAVFGAVILGGRLSALNWTGVLLIAVGAVLVAWKG